MAATKKRTTKKTAAKKPVAAVKAAAVSVAATPGCNCGRRLCWKKIIIFILGIVVGAAASCALHCGHKKFRGPFGPDFRPEFNAKGCLDTAKVKCPEALEKIQLKDANNDGCITKEELFGGKKFGPGAGKGDDRPQRRHRGPRQNAN